MPKNQKRILEMLAEKKITVEEAERLLVLITSENAAGNAGPEGVSGRKSAPKYLRVEVRPGSSAECSSKAERVNIRVPMSLIRAGVKFTSLIPRDAADKVDGALKEKGINFDIRNIKDEDIEQLVDALGDLEVNIEGKETVRVFAE